MSIFMQNILEFFSPHKASPECLISPINVLHRSNQNVHQTLTATFVLVGKLQVGCCLDLIHQTQMFALCFTKSLSLFAAQVALEVETMLVSWDTYKYFDLIRDLILDLV